MEYKPVSRPSKPSRAERRAQVEAKKDADTRRVAERDVAIDGLRESIAALHRAGVLPVICEIVTPLTGWRRILAELGLSPSDEDFVRAETWYGTERNQSLASRVARLTPIFGFLLPKSANAKHTPDRVIFDDGTVGDVMYWRTYYNGAGIHAPLGAGNSPLPPLEAYHAGNLCKIVTPQGFRFERRGSQGVWSGSLRPPTDEYSAAPILQLTDEVGMLHIKHEIDTILPEWPR